MEFNMLHKSVLTLALGVALCGTSLASNINNDNNTVVDNVAPRVQAANPFNYSEANLTLLQSFLQQYSEIESRAPGEETKIKRSEKFKTIIRMISNQQVGTNWGEAIKLIGDINKEELRLLPSTLTFVRMIQGNEVNMKKTNVEEKLEDIEKKQTVFVNKLEDIEKKRTGSISVNTMTALRAELTALRAQSTALRAQYNDLERFKNHMLITDQFYNTVFKSVYGRSESDHIAYLIAKNRGDYSSDESDSISSEE
jgi:hypothetical protein